MKDFDVATTVSKCKPGEVVGVEVAPRDDVEGYVGAALRGPWCKIHQGSQVVYVNRDTYREIKRQLGK